MIIKYDEIRIEPLWADAPKQHIAGMVVRFMFEGKEVKRDESDARSVTERVHLIDLCGEVDA